MEEHASLLILFMELVSNFREIMRRTLLLNWFIHSYKHASIVFPFIIASPRYFTKAITLGDLTQISSAFSHVQSSLSFVLKSYATIALWRSSTKRLIEFEKSLNELRLAKHHSRIKIIVSSRVQSIQIKALTVQIPLNDQQILIDNLNFLFEPHQNVLITGDISSVLVSFLKNKYGFLK